jgi:hypothetical protein
MLKQDSHEGIGTHLDVSKCLRELKLRIMLYYQLFNK